MSNSQSIRGPRNFPTIKSLLSLSNDRGDGAQETNDGSFNTDTGADIGTDLKGSSKSISGSSFPYGDERENDQHINGNLTKKPNLSVSSIRKSRHSVLSPDFSLWEERHETGHNELTSSQTAQRTEIESSHTGPDNNTDRATTSDILSEVSELSRYVRRYERRKDRKSNQDEHAQDRSLRTSNSRSMSIGMDGLVSSSSNRKNSAARGSYDDDDDDDDDVISYCTATDDDDIDDGSIRSQRLGISPYHATVYLESYHDRNETSSLEENKDPTILSKNGPQQEDNTRSTADTAVEYSIDNVAEGPNNDTISEVYDRSRSSSFSRRSKLTSTRLARLRANDAIIDSSNSDVNLTVGNGSIDGIVGRTRNNEDKKGRDGGGDYGFARLSLSRANKDKNTAAVVSAVTSHLIKNKNATTVSSSSLSSWSNKQRLNCSESEGSNTADKPNSSFNKLRTIFEQKTNEQPGPIYPPDEHWQYTSLGNKHK